MDAKLLTWKEARIIIDHYFSFWTDGEDKIWAKMIWNALETNGLTIYRSDEEEMLVRSRIGILALIYQEFCTRSELNQYNDTHFRKLQEHHLSSIFEDSNENIDKQISLILSALNKEYEGGGLFILMYESAFRGSHGSVTMQQVNETIEDVKKVIYNKDFCAEYDAFMFTMLGTSIKEFESI